MRLLFTTIYDPDPLLNRWSATDQMAYRLTRGQGIFTLREHAHAWPIHLLAQNTNHSSVVLEWPTLDEFIDELRTEPYDYVCITFMNRDMNKLGEMAAAVRTFQPAAQIVIGGYGVICLPDAKSDEVQPDCDHICRTEGVHFMRKLLHEDAAAPVSCYMPQSGAHLPWLSKRSRGTVGALLAGLGCIQRCPFCATSFYTKGRFLGVLDERGLYEGMLRYWAVNPFTSTVNIYDENFLDYKDRVDELGRLIRADRQHGLGKLNYFTFGSISALSKYEPDELLLNGLDTVWVGVESVFSRLKKRQGADPVELFDTLHSIGIKTIGSMIMGLDFQDNTVIVDDKDNFLRLNPTFQQISALTVEPNMPLGRVYQKRKAKRWPWDNFHLYGQTYEPKNFTFDELLDHIEDLYKRLYQENGPSITRMLRCNLNGYNYCRRSRNPQLREDKSRFFERRARAYAPLLEACTEFAPTAKVRASLDDLRREYNEAFGAMSESEAFFSQQVVRKAAIAFAERGEGDPPLWKDDYRRYVYDNRAAVAASQKPYRVQLPRKSGSGRAASAPRAVAIA
jgi:hypothetical protein